jgi:hypothetical protein
VFDPKAKLDLDAVDTRILPFLNLWLDWVEAGAPKSNRRFSRNYGLCRHFNRYIRAGGSSRGYAILNQVFQSLEPFPHYDLDVRDGTIHLSPSRVAWVRLQTGRQ